MKTQSMSTPRKDFGMDDFSDYTPEDREIIAKQANTIAFRAIKASRRQPDQQRAVAGFLCNLNL